ncbi:flagellar biosynthesis regulator FlaF [Gemmobacter serpentinus]|uniref:flagellar biosynthesis regulator FlaF n=1 Tax=Gemmobacter serpentinus TaxID=2652247 RepID=UPI00124DE7A2|nr:flagellar biosynthesis regulator FlaF [Gemmobacter serpentinus]
MNAQHFAQAAYGRLETPLRSARQIEYDLLARVTQRLTRAAQDKDRNFTGFITALHENTRLWRAFALDVAQAENALPDGLRARIVYLFRFTEQHGRKVMQGHGSVDILIEINTAIMRGLRGEGEAA